MSFVIKDIPKRGADRRPELRLQASPDLWNKVKRGAWGVVWLLLYRTSPRPVHWWRRMLLRLFGARIGPETKPYPGAIIWAPWNLSMGQGSVLADGVDCYNVDLVELEAGAIISQRAFLCTADRDIQDPTMPLRTGRILVRRKAWVAAEAYVAPGVEVEEGAVVAARAVALRNVAAWNVVAGNPARKVGVRTPT